MNNFCILRKEDIQEASKKILAAVDNSELSVITETLSLQAKGNIFYVSVTNGEYYVQVRIPLDEEIEFYAVVNANYFLRWIAQITNDTVQLRIIDNVLQMDAGGSHCKLPFVMQDDNLVTLPEITINNATKRFDISGNILNSITTYNAKELQKNVGAITKPVQRMYYVDEQGAITFTTGACVNSFTLKEPIKILLNNRLVKLFRLFKDEEIDFTLGYDTVDDSDIIQTKVRFESPTVTITAITGCDDSLIATVPSEAIRNRATCDYPFSINLNKDAFLQAVSRLLLFVTGVNVAKPYGTFEFKTDRVIIYDANKENQEELYYNNTELMMDKPYTAIIDLGDIKRALECCDESYLTFNFGNTQAIVIARPNVRNIIPEIH